MKLESKFVGAKSESISVRVTARQAMNYAAGVSDDNPWYFDDTREEGIVAPPMLATSITWALAKQGPKLWDMAGFQADLINHQVHCTECIQWRRVIKPEEDITVSGEIVAILPRRGGTLLVVRFDAVDAAGETVFTEYSGSLLRRVRCADEGTGADQLPQIPERTNGATPAWEERLPIHPLASHIFDGCADVYFPIHASRRFARSVRLPGTILQGTATLSMAARELINREGGGDPSRIQSVGCEFSGLVIPGTEIIMRLVGRAERANETDVFFEVLNAAGKVALSNGFATFRS